MLLNLILSLRHGCGNSLKKAWNYRSIHFPIKKETTMWNTIPLFLISSRLSERFYSFDTGRNASSPGTVKKGDIYFCICAFCLWNTSASGSITSWCGNGTWSYCVYVPVEAAGMDGFFRGFFFLFEGTLWFFPPVDRMAEMLGSVSVCVIRA